MSPNLNILDELRVSDGIVDMLIEGEWCIMRRAIQAEMVKIINETHAGVEACLRLAGEQANWPGKCTHKKTRLRDVARAVVSLEVYHMIPR